MSNTSLGGRVKIVPPNQVSAGRYSFLSLPEAEPNLGVAVENGSILSTNTSGTRTWIGGAQAAGSTSSGYLHYTGTTVNTSKLNSSTTDPIGTARLNYEGYFYATKFYGDGSSLTGINAGAIITDDITTNATRYLIFDDITSGSATSVGVSSTKLTFNPSTGTLSATKFAGDGSSLTNTITVITDDTTTDATRYLIFDDITSGPALTVGVSSTKLTFNPSTGTLSATKFAGDGSGLTGISGGGGGATITDDTTTNATRYLLFDDITSGLATSIGVSSSKLYYNPNTGTLNATNFNTLSDLALKTNISPIINPLDILKKLNPVSFDWKDNGNHSHGLIAQELEKVLPELVSGTNQKSVNYTALIAILIKAIQDLDNKLSK
jgi:hypothetical protein